MNEAPDIAAILPTCSVGDSLSLSVLTPTTKAAVVADSIAMTIRRLTSLRYIYTNTYPNTFNINNAWAAFSKLSLLKILYDSALPTIAITAEKENKKPILSALISK
ncbi:hypothetical protein VCRA2116O29_400041 [Vibrio crassostreae]|nr:hypothetical protein VCRA2116O29_400041 [Vibrio crassostreae]CAK3798305.1 hypothetical protein VCRA2123O74_360041 [Vibrio crassostreae]